MKRAVFAVLVASLSVATPAFALNGQQAITECGQTPQCTATALSDGHIFIELYNGGTIECMSLEGECFTIAEGGDKRASLSSGGKKNVPRFIVTPSLVSDGGSDGGSSGYTSDGPGASVPTGPMAPDP